MNQHDQYMADFMAIFQSLERWGPGSDEDSLRALEQVPVTPTQVADIGCGKGFATTLLAEHTRAQIMAVDNETGALDQLNQRLNALGLEDRVRTTCASMTELPFPPGHFDLIWAEASAYIMGVEKALTSWKTLLQPQGCMVISDLVWLTDSPSPAAVDFWQQEYPDMQTVAARKRQMQQTGYQVIDHFPLSQQAWVNYYEPLKARVNALKPQMAGSQALADCEREIALYEQHLGEFGYEMFILQL
ncbi:methyltransferase domain-containing protein [Marinobacterium sp. AK62]|uniref:Methyltransferase domain-containing protein n=1 Tax=Marinobacterium alkalitolerans TaxID=1542925 RepID=A0ABS3Z764_9GAMM|nr:class I SAM-dependent methyltransferase [Marinobacterium alkalitolerans]MBP0047547.1 methyltransferase domain-containing protein [Marinobacterium alkalitolerans]